MDSLRDLREPKQIAEREAERLAGVRRLSGFRTAELEHYCRIAAATFGAQAAGVTLVGSSDVQTIAAYGLEPAKLSRNDSLCSCVILQSDAFVLRDARTELAGMARCAGQPGFVPQFYAAVPLATSGGLHVGSLFVADLNACAVSTEKLEALKTLARLAVRELEHPRSEEPVVNTELATAANSLLRVLSGGAAHDFSELITGWIATVDALEKELLPGGEAHDLAGQLKRSLVPAARLNEHFKAFVEGVAEISDAVPVNQLVESAMKMLRHSIRCGTRVTVRPDLALDGMKIDTRDLELVLAALVLQADGSIGESDSISVSTGWEQFEEPRTTRFMTLDPGVYAIVSVEHTGRPPTPEERAELFDSNGAAIEITPLSLTARIVRRAGGAIDLYTSPDGGAIYKIYLPVIWRPRVGDGDPNQEGKIHILLVENHEVVLRGVKSALLGRGYRVSTAENGAEALQKFPQGTGFDMLVTDVVMDPVDGVALVEKMRQQRPELLVVFISGYDKVGVDPQRLPERTRFLSKPFTADALVQQVASLLPDRASEG